MGSTCVGRPKFVGQRGAFDRIEVSGRFLPFVCEFQTAATVAELETFPVAGGILKFGEIDQDMKIPEMLEVDLLTARRRVFTLGYAEGVFE